MSKQLTYTLWVEKYRPNSVNGILLPNDVKEFFAKLVEEKEIPNLLLYSSSPGVGKSTIAKALVNDIKSDHRGIDVLRSRISKFATSYSMFGDNEGGKKICILDEFDGATPELQSAMRAFMEEFQDNCRFILTCNYITKIIEPLKSRCQLFDFNMMDASSQEQVKPQIVKRLVGILKNENIQFKPEIVGKIVDTFYPDIRKMVNLLQQYSKKNGIIDSGIFNVEKVDTEFYEMILSKKLTAARTYLIERNYNYDELFRNLYDDLVPMLDKSAQAQAILLIAEYMYRNAFVIDKEINCTACLLEIIGLL
jgi:DNA polymerase III delta prime subunit